MTEPNPTTPLPAPTGGSPQTALATAERRPSRVRSVVAVICFVLAALLTTPAAVSFWAQRTLTDPQRYIETVGPLVQSPEVQQAIGDAAIQTFQEQVNVQALVEQVFEGVLTDRPRLQQLAGPIASGVNSLIEREVRSFIASSTFDDVWVAAQTRAQQAFIRLLEGDSSGAVSLQGDQVVLDIGQVLDQIKQRLIDRGLTVLQNVPIPDVNKQIVLMDAPNLAQARTMYAFFKPLSTWLLVVVGVLYLLAFMLARRRPLMAAAIGVSFILNALLVAFGLAVGQQLVVNALSSTVLAPASTVLYAQLLTFLERGWPVFLWLGVILLVAGWFAGVTRSGVAFRSWLARGLRAGGAKVATPSLVPTGRWISGNIAWLRVVVAAAGLVVLFWGLQMTASRLAWCTLLVVVVLVLLELAAGLADAKPRQNPPAVAQPASAG